MTTAVATADRAVQPLFAPGERVCWIGDSITHSGLWHSHVTLFHRTRFPAVDCTWANCGLSGDSAAGALRRFDWDIAPHRPTVAVLMLGMNDVERHLYGPEPADESRSAQRRRAIEIHARSMATLAERLVAMGARLVCVSPSIYDDTGRQQATNLVGVDHALATCGELARDLAERHGGRFIDLHTPMAACNAALQREDPDASIVGGDRVHPGPPGHLFMAYHVLRGLGATATVDTVDVHAGSGEADGDVTVEHHGPDGVALRHRPRSLPFPIPADAAAAGAWAPIQRALSCEILRCRGLRPGGYMIRIDDQPVAQADADELAAGLDLGGNPATPQYRQALRVAELNRERHRLISEELRTVAAVRHFLLERNGVVSSDLDAAETLATADLARVQAANNTFGIWQLGTFLRCHRRTSAITAEIARLDLAMAAEARPRERHVVITPTGG